MSKNYGIILAGGSGVRMGGAIPKQFLMLIDKPVIVHTIEAFQNHNEIDRICVVIHPDHIERVYEYKAAYKLDKIAAVIKGGETRQDSSYNALTGYTYDDGDILVFHDAVRPFVSAKMISESIAAAKESGAAAVCVPSTDTIVQGDGYGAIADMPDRTNLYNAQTPQVFRYKVIKEAHDTARAGNFRQTTDDVRLVINAGNKVRIVQGNYENIKITNAGDMIVAEAIALKKKNDYGKK